MRFPHLFKISREFDTAVEIGRSYLKVAESEISGKGASISKLIVEPISGLSDDEVSKTLSDIIRTNNIRLAKLIAVIPRERIMLRSIHLPAVAPEEIEDMISFEIAKQMPYSRDEVISDYRVVKADSEGYSDIILAIIHKDEADRLNSILSAAAGRPQQVRLSSEAMLTWFESVAGGELVGKNICLVDIDAERSEIAIIYEGRLLFSRAVSIGASGIAEDKSAATAALNKRLVEEIKNSIGIYEKEEGKEASSLSEIIVIGAASVAESLASLIKQEMDIPCRNINILASLPLADGALTEKGIPPDASICAISGSLFLKEGINLIPEELRKKEKAQIKTRSLISGIAVLITIAALVYAAGLIKLYEKRQLLARIDSMLKQVEPAARSAEEKLKRLNLAKQQFSEGASTLDVLYNLYRLIPENISLLDFDYEESSRTLRFRGTAMAMSDVFRLAAMLEESDRFKDVKTRSVAKRRTREGEVADFQISCIFVPSEGAK